MEKETRWIECPGCDGEGGRMVVTHMDCYGNPGGYFELCGVCNGRREIEIEVEPITMGDLEPDMGTKDEL